MKEYLDANGLTRFYNNKIKELYARKIDVGSPLKASTASDMIDPDKIYVYTGSESGFYNGHWYYFDGLDWFDGGVYNSAAVVTDKTLSLEDIPADAKVTGDEITDLKSALDELDKYVISGGFINNYIVGKNLSANSALIHNIIDDPNSCISDYIPVTWGTAKVKFIYTDDAEDSNSYQIWFLDSNKDFIIYKGRNATGTNLRNNIDTPANAAYVLISFKNGFAGQVTNTTNPPTDIYYIAETTHLNGLINDIGDLQNLTTTEKDSVVFAINEVNEKASDYDQAFEYVEVTDEYSYSDTEITWTDGVKRYTGSHLTGGSYDSYHFCYFDVQEGDVIVTATSRFRDRCEFYNDTVVSTTDMTDFKQYTVPQGVNKVALTRHKNIVKDIILYCKRNVLSVTEEALKNNAWKAVNNNTILLDDTIINLPSKIYALVGFELNIYFDNIVENCSEYQWNVTCQKGMQLERGFRVTPTSSDVGEYPITIEIRKGESDKSVTSTLVITSSNSEVGDTISVIILGDSTTYNGTVISKLHDNFNTISTGLSTLGTIGTSPNNHEGRSGWTLNDYFTKESITYPSGDPRGTIYNAFYNPATQTFDAAYYFANSMVSQPDWFIINMGINDMFGYTSDDALQNQIETCLDYLDSMVTSIKGVSANIKIGICVTIPPNHSQDAFGKAYACGQTRNRYKHNNAVWANALINAYKESSDVMLIPIHTNLDTVYNMGMETIPVNARNTDITYESPIGNGGVHPAGVGYWQIADVYTAFLKAQI